MTKEEFLNYVDSFGKDKGEFTEEELYEIGTRYKEEIRLSEKNWTELVDLLGVVDENGDLKNGEAFRCWIKAKQKEDGTLKKNVKLLTGQTIEDISMPDLEDKLAEIKREHYKDLTKVRDEYNLYRNVLREDARTERFYEKFLDIVSNIKPFEKTEGYDLYKSEEGKEDVMLFSDLHYGTKVNAFYNTYNTEIAKRSVQTYVDWEIKHCQEEKIQRLNFVNLGDLYMGALHVTARLDQEVNVIEQIMDVCEILAGALFQLQEVVPEVVYRSCTDNHSRLMPNFKENIESENFSKVIDFYLKARLKGSKVIFADDNIDEEIGSFKLMNGKKFMFVHGHHDSYNLICQNLIGATKEYIDYIALGHWHCSKLKTFQGIKVFVNGSILGTDSYAYSKRLFGEPEQTVITFSDNCVSTHYVSVR